MGLEGRMVRGAVWSAADSWGRQAISLFVFLTLARLLSPTDIGLFAIVMVVFALLQSFIDDGIGEAVVQRYELDRGHLDVAFWLNLGVSGLAAAAGVAAAPLLARLFDEPRLGALIPAMAPVLVLSALSGIHQALLKRHLAYRVLAMRSVLAIVVGGGVGIAMALTGHGVWSLVAQQIIEKIIGAIVLWARSDWRPGLSFSRARARDLLPYSANIVTARILLFGHKQLDRFLIGLLLGPTALGFYSLAMRVLDTLNMLFIFTPTNFAIAALSRQQTEPARMRATFATMVELTGLVAIPAFVGLAVVAPVLVPMVFGETWRPSGALLQVLALMSVPSLIGGFAATAARATGRPGWFLAILSLGTVGNILAVMLTVGSGIDHVAAALVCREVLFVPLYALMVSRRLGIGMGAYLGRVLPAVAAAGVMAGAMLAARGVTAGSHLPELAALAVEIAAGCVVYGVMMLAVGRLAVLRDLLPPRPARVPGGE